MPSEKFYASSDKQTPVVTIAWGAPGPGNHSGVRVNDVRFSRTEISRMIRTLRRARSQVFGIDA